MFGDDAITLSSQNTVRTRDLSIGARVNRQLNKKGKVIHAKLYGRERGHSTQSMNNSFTESVNIVDQDDARSVNMNKSIVSNRSKKFKIRRTNSINNSMISDTNVSKTKPSRPPRLGSKTKRAGSRTSRISRNSKQSKKLRPIPNTLRSQVSYNDNDSMDSDDSIEAFLRETQAKLLKTKQELGQFREQTDKIFTSTTDSFYQNKPVHESTDLLNRSNLSSSTLPQPKPRNHMSQSHIPTPNNRKMKQPIKTSGRIKLSPLSKQKM